MCIRKALEYQNYLAMKEAKTTKGIKGWILRKQINENNYMSRVNKMFDKCNSTDKEVIRIQFMKTSASGELTIINLMKQYKGELDKPLHKELLNELEKWVKANI